jgi:hypothetical protein
MRTTVDIELPLLKRLRAEAQRRGMSVKDLLQGLIRRGLEERPAGQRPYRVQSFAMGTPNPTFNLDKALAVASGLEDGEIARELAVRK